MKTLVLFLVVFGSMSGFAEEKSSLQKKVEAKWKTVDQKTAEKKTDAPCADDKKEDILKKLEEEKKKQAQAGKGLSLQGNKDTGCSL